MIIRNGFYSTLPILLMLFVAIQVFGEQKSEGDEASSVSKKSQQFVKPVILEISNQVNPPGKDASPQSCYVDLSIPDTATVRLDGDYYGDERLFEFSPIKSNEAVTAILEVVFANGTRESRKIDLIAGKHIKLRIEEPVAGSPEDNERKNTQTGERDVAVAPSNSRSVTEENQENGFPESAIPQDKCIVDITVPKETKIEVDGIDYETQRGFEFTSLSPDEVYQNQFVFHFPNGQKQKKKLLIQGGKRVRLALQEPSPVQPELVLQTGHSEEITSIAFSPDGKHFMTGSVGGKAILWDSETGVQLRTYQSGALHKNDIAQLMSKFERSIFPGTTSSYSLASKSALPKILSIDFSSTGKRRFMISCAPYGFFGGGFTTAVSGFVFDVESGEQLHSFPLRESLIDLEYISPVSLNPDGKNLIVGGRGNREISLQNAYLQGLGDPRLLTEQSLSILDIKSNKIIGGAGGTNRAITLLKFSPDKKKIVTIGKNYLQNPAIYESISSRLTQVIAETIQYLKQSNLTQREVEEFYAGKSPNGEKMRTVNLYLNKQAEILDALDQESIIPEDEIENILQIWDPNSLSEIRNFKIPKSPVYLSVSNEGQYVLLGYRSNRDFGPVDWELWDTIAQKILLKFQAGRDPVLTPDGRYVVSYGNRNLNSNSSDHRIHFWNTETLTDVGSIKNEKTNISSQICPLPDSRHVAVLYSYQIEIYEIPTGRLIRTYRFHATDPLDTHQLSPKGKYIVIGDGLWDTQTGMKSLNLINGSIEKSGEFLADTISTYHVTSDISPDGQSVAYAKAKDNIVRLSSIQNGSQIQKYQLPSGECTFLRFSLDGRQLLTVSDTGHITVWNTMSGEILNELQTQSSNNASSIIRSPGPKSFSPDGKRVFVYDRATQTIWWNRENGKRLNRPPGNGMDLKGQEIYSYQKTEDNVVKSKDGQLILSFSEKKNSILLKESQSNRLIYNLQGENSQLATAIPIRFSSVGFDKSEQYIFAEYSAPVFEGWDTTTGEKLSDFPSDFLEIIHSAKSVIIQKELIAAALPNGDVALLNITTGERISTLKHQSEVHSIAFHSNRNQLLAGCADRTAILWDLTDNSILQTFKGHEGPIDSVSLKTDGTLALTTSAVDSTTRIWDVSTGKELCALISINNRIDWLVVTPEGLFDGSAGGRKEVVFRIGGGLNVVPVDRFFQDFYYPGLLSAIWRDERPLPEIRLGENLPPKLKIVSPGEGDIIETPQVTLEVEAVDQGGGYLD
ncbi:MAG: hypothetical protein CME33_05835 [Gimesia sp.]|uniref:WD40 repeat domain-containing protein n=1 Tax=Gimesia sp. TaxID=2024833 RepID=UPI000C65748B|nr:hypothetical protein [Gimesia sp.]MAX36068.1 hypothetical protein [Gimesia sp.]|tara:strand:- start:4214 stop:7954 length:3741 start_codon:yes stop_codon:yes gene_type:complete